MHFFGGRSSLCIEACALSASPSDLQRVHAAPFLSSIMQRAAAAAQATARTASEATTTAASDAASDHEAEATMTTAVVPIPKGEGGNASPTHQMHDDAFNSARGRPSDLPRECVPGCSLFTARSVISAVDSVCEPGGGGRRAFVPCCTKSAAVGPGGGFQEGGVNVVCIGAAYAMAVHRAQVGRVLIVSFGGRLPMRGTAECQKGLVAPEGGQWWEVNGYRPWRDDQDAANVLCVDVYHGSDEAGEGYEESKQDEAGSNSMAKQAEEGTGQGGMLGGGVVGVNVGGGDAGPVEFRRAFSGELETRMQRFKPDLVRGSFL
jgi:hypothetical protein